MKKILLPLLLTCIACSSQEDKVGTTNVSSSLDSLLVVARAEKEQRQSTDSIMNLLGNSLDSINQLQKLIQEVKQHKGTLKGASGMNEKVSQLENLLQASMSRITVLQTKLQNTQDISDKSVQEVIIMTNQMEKLKETNRTKGGQDGEITALYHQIEKLKEENRRKSGNEELVSLQKQLEVLKDAVRQKTGNADEVTALQSQIEKLKEVNRQNSEKDKQIEALTSQIEKLKETNQQKTTPNGAGDVALLQDMLEKQKEAMRTQSTTYQQEILNLKQQLVTVASTKGVSLSSEKRGNNASNSGLLKLIEQLKEQLRLKEEEILTLRAELRGVKEVLGVVSKEKNQLTQVVIQKDQALQTATDALSNQQKQAETLKQQIRIISDLRNLLAEGDAEMAKGEAMTKGIGGLFKKGKAKVHYEKAVAVYRRAYDLSSQQGEISPATIKDKLASAEAKLK